MELYGMRDTLKISLLFREALMLLHDFSDRAEEYVLLAQRAKTLHDRDLFTEMARAWYGIKDDTRERSTLQDESTRH